MGARTTFLIAAAKILALPPLVLRLVFQFYPASFWTQVLLQAAAIPAFFLCREKYRQYKQDFHAARLGAVPIPRVKGKLPGNIDIAARLVRYFNTKYVAVAFRELLEEYDTNILNLRVLWTDSIVTIDEGHIKCILATGFPNFEKGKLSRERMEDFFGTGIFNRDGEEWKSHRAMTKPYFNKERISDFEIFWKHTVLSMDVLSKLAASPVPILDVQDLFGRFTLDAATEFMFGKSLDTLHRPLPVPGEAKMGPKGSASDDDFGDFAQAFESAQVVITVRNLKGRTWPLYELFGLKTAQSMKTIHEYLDPLVQNALKQKAERSKSGLADSERTLLDQLVASTTDQVIIRDELLNILLAGRDTTAALLTFTIYMIALHPEVGDRLREEMAQHCPNGQPAYQTIRDMKYLRAVLNEVLRLFPPVPINVRNSKDESFLFPPPASKPDQRPYYLPANTVVVYSTLLLQRRKDLWGEDAHEFKPERWLDTTLAARYFSSFSWIAFNGGPRICPGQNFAYNEASYHLCSLIPRFKFSLAPEYQPKGSLPRPEWAVEGVGREKFEKIWPLNSMTIFAKGGLWMKVTEIEQS